MLKKAELEQQLKQRTQELLTLSNEHKQLQRLLALASLAVQVSKEDIERTLEPVTLCDETGSEQTDRYEQGLKLAKTRLSVLSQALSSQSPLNFLDPLWKAVQSEDEQLSAYLQQSPGEDLAQ